VTPPATIVLLVGGDEADWSGSPSLVEAAAVPSGAVVVAADSGLHVAAALGLRVDHLVGDLDSADRPAVVAAERAGTVVHRHPADKDATDSELALDLVLELAATVSDQFEVAPAEGDEGPGGPSPSGGEQVELLVLGGGGGRLDHLLADVFALASPRLLPLEITARFGGATVTVVRPGRPRRVHGRGGEQVSLLPMSGRARGVTTDALRWPLVDADLGVGTTRGVSNEMLGPEARVAVTEGVLLIVQPGTVASPIEPRRSTYDPTPIDSTTS